MNERSDTDSGPGPLAGRFAGSTASTTARPTTLASQDSGKLFGSGVVGNAKKELRAKQRADEELEKQTEEIAAEAERRIAADPEHEKKIQERAAAALEEEVAGIVVQHCAMRRPEWESYFGDVRWNEVVAEIESERSAAIISRLREKEK